MGAHAVGHRFDQVRSVAAARPVGSRADGSIDAEDVVAIDPNTREAVTLGALRNGSSSLLGKRYRNSPVVVLAQENHGGFEDAGKVHRLVPVALRRRAIAEGPQDNV